MIINFNEIGTGGGGTAGVSSINGQTGALSMKTVNGNSLLGTGDIPISGSGVEIKVLNNLTASELQGVYNAITGNTFVPNEYMYRYADADIIMDSVVENSTYANGVANIYVSYTYPWANEKIVRKLILSSEGVLTIDHNLSAIVQANAYTNSAITSALTNYYTSGETDSAITSAITSQQFKTINGSGITGEGNLVIGGGSGSEVNYQIVEDLSAVTTYQEGTYAFVKSSDINVSGWTVSVDNTQAEEGTIYIYISDPDSNTSELNLYYWFREGEPIEVRYNNASIGENWINASHTKISCEVGSTTGTTYIYFYPDEGYSVASATGMNGLSLTSGSIPNPIHNSYKMYRYDGTSWEEQNDFVVLNMLSAAEGMAEWSKMHDAYPNLDISKYLVYNGQYDSLIPVAVNYSQSTYFELGATLFTGDNFRGERWIFGNDGVASLMSVKEFSPDVINYVDMGQVVAINAIFNSTGFTTTTEQAETATYDSLTGVDGLVDYGVLTLMIKGEYNWSGYSNIRYLPGFRLRIETGMVDGEGNPMYKELFNPAVFRDVTDSITQDGKTFYFHKFDYGEYVLTAYIESGNLAIKVNLVAAGGGGSNTIIINDTNKYDSGFTSALAQEIISNTGWTGEIIYVTSSSTSQHYPIVVRMTDMEVSGNTVTFYGSKTKFMDTARDGAIMYSLTLKTNATASSTRTKENLLGGAVFNFFISDITGGTAVIGTKPYYNDEIYDFLKMRAQYSRRVGNTYLIPEVHLVYNDETNPSLGYLQHYWFENTVLYMKFIIRVGSTEYVGIYSCSSGNTLTTVSWDTYANYLHTLLGV